MALGCAGPFSLTTPSVLARSASISASWRELVVQFALQRKRLAQARLVAGQPDLRVGDAAAMLFKFGVHPVEGVLQPGDDPDRRRLAVDADRLRERPSVPARGRGSSRASCRPARMSQVRSKPPMRPTVQRALGAFPRGKTDLRQQRSAGGLALRDRPSLDLHGERVAAGRLPPGEVDW